MIKQYLTTFLCLILWNLSAAHFCLTHGLSSSLYLSLVIISLGGAYLATKVITERQDGF